MKTGFSQVSITPDGPCALAGYYKSRPAAGVHDEVYVRALVFPGPVVILSLDLLCVDELSMDRILRALAPLGVGEDRLLVTAVHTHSSFGGIFDTSEGIKRELRSMFGETSEALLAMLAERCARAVKEAMADMAETEIRFAKGSIDGLGTNRHSPKLPHDRDLFIIELFRAGGKKILLYNLSCHPTILDGGNLLISADFPGTVASRLQGVYDMVVFINGSAGDVSTRFTRRESSFAECDRLGVLAAGRIMELTAAAGAAEPLERVELAYHEFCLKEAAVDEAVAAEEKLAAARRGLEAVKSSAANAGDIRHAESFVEAAFFNLIKVKAADSREAGDIALRTGILFINDKTILCVPLELFSSLALGLKSRVPVELFGYANDVKGYLADMAAYESLDYEALSSPFAAGEGERYIEAVREFWFPRRVSSKTP